MTKPITSLTGPRLALPQAAKQLGMTAPGALKLLRRTGRAIRDDGHWSVSRNDLRAIQRARTLLGLCSIAGRETSVHRDPDATHECGRSSPSRGRR